VSPLDLVVCGGTVGAPDGARRADVGVAGGRVTAEPAGRLVTPEPTEERDR